MAVIVIKSSVLIFLIISLYISTKCCEASMMLNINEMIYRLPENTAPRLYRINLEPHIDAPEFTFDGTSSIDFEVLKPTQIVTIHASKLIEIDRTYTKILCNNGSILKPISQEYDSFFEFFSLKLNNTLELGNYTVEFKWRGHDATDLRGFYRTYYSTTDKHQNPRTEYAVVTHFEPSAARSAYPCWDEPALKAEFDISLKHYPNYTALSNMPVKSITSAEDGKVWTRFQRTPLMSTYTSAFIVSAFSRYTDAHSNHTLWVWKDKIEEVKYVIERSQKIMEFMEEYTGIRYTMPKIDHVFVPQFPIIGAMENWGLIIYSGDSFFNAMRYDKFLVDLMIFHTINHEVAHQWFGNLITPARWNEVWLSEAFATYFSENFGNEMSSASDIKHYYLSSTPRKRVEISPIRVTSEDSAPEFNSKLEAYRGGPLVVEMLKHILTDKVFRNGIRNFLSEHQYSTAVTDDLWKALQGAYSNEELSPALNIKEIMDPWIDQAGFPVLNVTRDYETGLVTITQMNIINSETNNSWTIPINYATRSQPNFTSTRPTHWMPRFSEEYTLTGIPKDDWLILNIQYKYYYQVNYDWENYKRIVDYLNSENYDKIHVVNRFQLVYDILYLTGQDSRYHELMIDVMSYLHRESHHLPWKPVLEFITNNQYYWEEAWHYDNISKWMLHLINNTMNHIGFNYRDEINFETLMIKRELFKCACTFGHKGCRSEVTKRLIDKFTSGSQSQDLFNDIVGEVHSNNTYCIGLMDANETIWDLIMNSHFAKARMTSNYAFLGCTENPMLIEKYLSLVLSKDGAYDDVTSAFTSLASHTRKTADIGFDYLIKNYETIKNYFSSLESGSFYNLIEKFASFVTNTDQFNKFRIFLNEKMEKGAINGTAIKAIEIAENSLRKSITRSEGLNDLLGKSRYFRNFMNQLNEV